MGDDIPEPAHLSDVSGCVLTYSNVVRLVLVQDILTTGVGILRVPKCKSDKKDDNLLRGSELRSILQSAASSGAAGVFVDSYNGDDS